MNRKLVLAGLALGVLACGAGCDDEGGAKPAAAPSQRSQAVVTSAVNQPSNGAEPTTAPAKVEAPPKQERRLCEPRSGKARKSVPQDGAMGRAAAPGEPAPSVRLPVGGGQVTWVNFWAAWCVPCKEEIPRLLAWEKQLTEEGTPLRVVFVSLDDDERQLRDFLAQQPATGLRSTYWLREGAEREGWLARVGMDADPRLPVHLLVSGRGDTDCVVEGAVEDEDLAEVRRLVTAAAAQ